MSRADFFLVVSAEIGELDPDDTWVQDAVARVLSNSLESDRERFMSGPVDVRVIDARHSGEVTR